AAVAFDGNQSGGNKVESDGGKKTKEEEESEYVKRVKQAGAIEVEPPPPYNMQTLHRALPDDSTREAEGDNNKILGASSEVLYPSIPRGDHWSEGVKIVHTPSPAPTPMPVVVHPDAPIASPKPGKSKAKAWRGLFRSGGGGGGTSEGESDSDGGGREVGELVLAPAAAGAEPPGGGSGSGGIEGGGTGGGGGNNLPDDGGPGGAGHALHTRVPAVPYPYLHDLPPTAKNPLHPSATHVFLKEEWEPGMQVSSTPSWLNRSAETSWRCVWVELVLEEGWKVCVWDTVKGRGSRGEVLFMKKPSTPPTTSYALRHAVIVPPRTGYGADKKNLLVIRLVSGRHIVLSFPNSEVAEAWGVGIKAATEIATRDVGKKGGGVGGLGVGGGRNVRA
ncbi:hypothetical protein HK104_004863, partial [Borealophlyctis nickersoniae]